MSQPRIRLAQAGDEGAVVALIRRLAAFERSPDAVALTEEAVRRDVLGPHPRLRVLLAELAGTPCGIATLVDIYSSWAGAPAMLLHDLFVDEEVRGRGLGRMLLAEAAKLALDVGCCRLDVNVLAWNGPARRFYGDCGFVMLEDWQPWRLDRQGLRALAFHPVRRADETHR